MPLYHCQDCHHEWEASEPRPCDWCGDDSYVLAEKTGLELCCEAAIELAKEQQKGDN